MSDLRRSATAVKRNHSHKAKWAHGARQYGRDAPLLDKWSIDSAGPVRLRPVAAASSATTIALKRYNESNIKSVQHANETHLRHDVAEALTSSDSSSSSDEVIMAHDGVGVVLDVDDVDIDVDDNDDFSAYAVSGNNVLATAVQKAELKYENQVTEKLAKEYEFVPRGEEHATGYTADVDDDFEIIDHDSV